MTLEHRKKISEAHMGMKLSEETKLKKSIAMKNKWRNDQEYKVRMSDAHKSKVGTWSGSYKEYVALHDWIRRQVGSAKSCIVCGESNKRIHWANLSGNYEKDTLDYTPLCTQCHAFWDDGLMAINLFEWNQKLTIDDQ